MNEYKQESFALFEALLSNLRQAVTGQMMRVELVQQAADADDFGDLEGIEASHSEFDDELDDQVGNYGQAIITPERAEAATERDPDDPATWGKVGRNEPCPCGSGKKYKHCHGAL